MTSERIRQTALLHEPVSSLRFVKAARAGQLERLGIHTRRDLIEHFPRRYLDMTEVTSVEAARIGDQVTCVGTVGEVTVRRPRRRLTIVEASLIDESGVLFGTWFNQPWVANSLKTGTRVTFSGTVEFNFGYKRMNSPFFEVLGEGPDDGSGVGRVIAIHPLTEGISSAWMRRLVATALEDADLVCDPLPVELRVKRDLMPRKDAWHDVHFPATMELAQQARERLAYEELLCLQLFLRMRRLGESGEVMPIPHRVDGPLLARMRSELPFALTDEQETAFGEIAADMASERIMNRMLLGDVGTGKTAIALLSLVIAADSGRQACMMAPTSVLAEQYRVKLGPLLDAVGIPWALLTGASSSSERERIRGGLADGSIRVAFGTHALIEPDITFDTLSLVIIDEQHRFGVEQRSALRAKGPGCDLLVMTATPIPRTLALTLYGDLECSYLRTRPKATAPTATKLLTKRGIARAYDAVRRAHAEGRQAYIVCPLVGVKTGRKDDGATEDLNRRIEAGDDVTDMKAAIDEQRFLATKVFPQMEVGLVTGRMGFEEKEAVMQRFRDGDIDVLVSTTVIEVGVDVPNATVMVVHDADRFGLSQLHQLRGRVGRGEHPGEVYLIATARTEEARKRLGALEATDDGFKLAEYDLALRHEGDVLGCRQHGYPPLKLVDIERDRPLIDAAHEDARMLLERHPGLDDAVCRPLAEELHERFGKASQHGDGA